MLLTLSTTMPDATDLGFLLHKHPDRAQSFETAVGVAHVVWPEATSARATVALLLEVDPVALVRGRRLKGADGFALGQYVNDRPYAASSLFAVALSKVFRSAMSGICVARPELVDRPVPLTVTVPALPSSGGEELVRRLFEPLGWTVAATAVPLDPAFPAWGASRYLSVELSATSTVRDALTQLYVLLPVLDDGKHYWVGDDEVEKLLRAGEGWLGAHSEHALITRRYLTHRRHLVTSALDRLHERDETVPDDAPPDLGEDVQEVERPRPLAAVRAEAVLEALREEGAASVVDLGCGEGALLRRLIKETRFRTVVGVDVSHRALEVAEKRMGTLPDTQRSRLSLLQSSATYRDDRLAGHDAVVLMEVVEHVDPPRLPALERSVFAHARPVTVVVTTPNVEHNVRYESLRAGALRHRDHRFEWTRAEFTAWCATAATAHGYEVRYVAIGDDDPQVGPPTQMAVFRRTA